MMHWFTGARRISRDDITRWNPAPLSRTSCPCVRWGTPHRRLNLRCYSAPQVFQHPNPCCCCKTGTSRQDGFAPHAGRGPARTPAAARTDPIRAHTKPARGAPRGRTGPPLPAPPGGGPAAAEGPLPQARRPLPRGRVPGPPLRSPGGATKASPRRPAPSRRWGVTYRSAALAGRRGGSHSAGAGEGVAVTDGRRRAEAARSGGSGASSLPAPNRAELTAGSAAAARGSRTARPLTAAPAPLPPHFRTGRGHAVPRRAASIRGLRDATPLTPSQPPRGARGGARGGRWDGGGGSGVLAVWSAAVRGRGAAHRVAAAQGAVAWSRHPVTVPGLELPGTSFFFVGSFISSWSSPENDTRWTTSWPNQLQLLHLSNTSITHTHRCVLTQPSPSCPSQPSSWHGCFNSLPLTRSTQQLWEELFPMVLVGQIAPRY